MRKWQQLTRNRDVSFELTPLGIGKKEHDPFTVLATENPEVLADTLFPSAFGLSLGHAAKEDKFGAEKQLLETYAV